MARFFLPKISFILTLLLFGFVATVYALKPDSVSKQQASARLVNAPVYRVVSDTAELAGEDLPAGPAKVLVAELMEAMQSEASSVPAEFQHRTGSETAEPVARTASQEPAVPPSLGLMPVAEGAVVGSADPKAASNPTRLEIEELKDLGMASISAGGSWYTLQSAYVPASDKNMLNRRLMELSEAVGSREGIFIYQSSRSEGVFLGVCVKRFASAAQAKNFKKGLDKKLGYPSQLRSQKGLQTEVGF